MSLGSQELNASIYLNNMKTFHLSLTASVNQNFHVSGIKLMYSPPKFLVTLQYLMTFIRGPDGRAQIKTNISSSGNVKFIYSSHGNSSMKKTKSFQFLEKLFLLIVSFALSFFGYAHLYKVFV